MKHDEYTGWVDAGRWPDDSLVPLPEPFENHNGTIQNLVLRQVTSVAAIKSKPGAMRANHYHKTDWHYTYVTHGLVLYLERSVGSDEIPEVMRFREGQMFFTPPMREHCMIFPQWTTIITMARNVRSHESHEEDVVRVPFVDEDLRDRLIAESRKVTVQELQAVLNEPEP